MGCAISDGDFVHGGHVSRGEESAITAGDLRRGKRQHCWRHSESATALGDSA